MAGEAGFKVEGLSRVVRGLQLLGLEVADLKGPRAAIAAPGAQLAAAAAPRRSGRLAADVRGNRAKGKAVVTAGRASVPYAGPINYGWPKRGIAPAGFMQKADQQMRPVAIARLEEEINRKIRAKGLA